MILAALLLLAASQPRTFAEERALLDRRLEALRRLLPDGPTAAADVAQLREAALAARLQSFEAVPRAPVETAAVSHVVVDIAGNARFVDVERFFRQLGLLPRPIDVEALTLKATPEELVHLTAVVRFPYRSKKAPLPPPPVGARAPAGVPRPTLETLMRDHALAFAKSEALASLRRSRRNPRLFLSELAAVARERPVVFTEAELSEQFQVRGLTVGEHPSRELEARFERGFFRLAEFLMVRQGACRRFEARGQSPVAGPEAELPLPMEDPFRQDDGSCRIDRDTGRAVMLEGPPARPRRAAPDGLLSLRLRDVDLADLFFVLHKITGRGFAVGGDVVGRVNVEVASATLDEVFQALRKSGLQLQDAGAMVRVSQAPLPAPRAPFVGPPPPDAAEASPERRAGFELKREGVREILAVMTDMDPALAVLGPDGALGSASLWVANAPLVDVRSALLATTGLVERFEEGRRVVRRAGSGESPVYPVAGGATSRKLALSASDLDLSDFDFVGVATAGAGYAAFAYAPTGRLHAYRPGDKLAEGVVRAVNATDVELETDEGRIRLLLPPLSR